MKLVTLWFLIVVLTTPDVDKIQYKSFNSYHTLEQCQFIARGVVDFMMNIQQQQGKEFWIQPYCLPVKAYEKNLIEPKPEKKKTNGVPV